jgi:hypothetical protein
MPKAFEVLKLADVCETIERVAGREKRGILLASNNHIASGPESNFNFGSKISTADSQMKQKIAMFKKL